MALMQIKKIITYGKIPQICSVLFLISILTSNIGNTEKKNKKVWEPEAKQKCILRKGWLYIKSY